MHASPTGPLATRHGRAWRPAVAAAAAVTAALGLAACGGGTTPTASPTTAAGGSSTTAAPSGSSTTAAPSGSATTAAPSGKSYTIAMVPGITTDPFYITMHVGAAKEAKKLGVKLVWQGGTAFTPSSQTPVVNALFAQHPSALIIAPTDSTGMKAPIQQFTKANIPVVSVDTTLKDTSILDARITSDNTQGGKAAADTLAKLAHGKGSVAIINVNPGVSTTDARQAGFIKEMQTKYPNMKIVAKEYDQDSATKAATEASSIMLANPNLVGIFGTNVFSAEGAGKAVQSAHKGGKVFVAGYDAEPAEVKLLKSGVINALVMQQPAKEGSLAVQDAYDILTGKKSQVTKSVTLPNVVATTKTASNPDVSKYFYASSFNG